MDEDHIGEPPPWPYLDRPIQPGAALWIVAFALMGVWALGRYVAPWIAGWFV